MPDLANQFAGIFQRAYITIRPRSEFVLVGRIYKPEYAQFHGELASADEYEPHFGDLKFKEWPLTSTPFEIFLKDGAITHMAFDKTVTNEQANQIKGIVSQFQLDTEYENVIKCKYNQLPEKNVYNAYYKVMEPTVTGHCETLYDVSPFPKYLIQTYPYLVPFPFLAYNDNFFEFVKTKNYSSCEQRMGYHYGFTPMSDFKPGTNQMGDFFTVSNHTKFK